MPPLRVLIVDDESLARERIRSLLRDVPDVAVVGECRDGREAVAALREIDYAHMARAVQLAFATAWQVANQDAAPDRPVVLPAAGYICPPCPVGCDHLVFDHPDACPICGMGLIPRTDAAR